jgi:hypothetical protein
MSTWSGRLLAVVTWLAVVTLGAVLVWVVISRAGAGLVSDAVTVPTQPTATSSDQTSPGPTSEPRRGTWQGDVGVVTADCRGAEITLAGAQPEDDVVVKVVDEGPDQLVVTFRGEDAGTVTLVARCRGGRPAFAVSDGAPSSPTPAGATPSGSGSPSDHGSDTGSETSDTETSDNGSDTGDG